MSRFPNKEGHLRRTEHRRAKGKPCEKWRRKARLSQTTYLQRSHSSLPGSSNIYPPAVSVIKTLFPSPVLQCFSGRVWIKNEGGSFAVVWDFAAAERLLWLGGIIRVQIVWWKLEKRWENRAVLQESGLQQHGAPSGVAPGLSLFPEQNSDTVSTYIQMHAVKTHPTSH